MLDLKRRKTLKVIAAAPLMSLPIVASSNVTNLSESNLLKLPIAATRTSMELEIQIIDSHAVPDNSVVFRNNSDEKLIITKFMPGPIIFDEKLVDLNAVIGDQSLELLVGQSKVFQFAILSAVDAGLIEYVWADHAVDVLSEQTSVVTLGAFMADTNAVVYANTQRSVPS